MALRGARQVNLLKKESTVGVDASPVVGSDAIEAEAGYPDGNQDLEQANEATGSLDPGKSSLGALMITNPLNLRVRGQASAGVAPEWAPLVETAGFLETLQAVVPTTGTGTATAGAGNSVTIDRSADTDFSATDDAYNGMVVELGGNPATAVRRHILDYEVTGNNCVFTLDGPAFSPVLDTSTTVKVLPQALYTTHSGVIPSATLYHYIDGKLWKYLGGRSEAAVTWTKAKSVRMAATLHSLFSSETDAALPDTTGAFPTTSYPQWRNGTAYLNDLAVGMETATLTLGNTLEPPPNPNEQEGIEAQEIGARRITLAVDANEVLKATLDIFEGLFRTQTSIRFSCMTDTAGTAGNRIGHVGARDVADRRARAGLARHLREQATHRRSAGARHQLFSQRVLGGTPPQKGAAHAAH